MAIDLQKLEQKFSDLFADPNIEQEFEAFLEAKQKQALRQADVSLSLPPDYWQRRCALAEKYIAESPCDPDITKEQTEAWALRPTVRACFAGRELVALPVSNEQQFTKYSSAKFITSSHTCSKPFVGCCTANK